MTRWSPSHQESSEANTRHTEPRRDSNRGGRGSCSSAGSDDKAKQTALDAEPALARMRCIVVVVVVAFSV